MHANFRFVLTRVLSFRQMFVTRTSNICILFHDHECSPVVCHYSVCYSNLTDVYDYLSHTTHCYLQYTGHGTVNGRGLSAYSLSCT